MLDRLPERDREILILFELEELSGDRIAALLGIKVDNVWVRMHRARERFLKVFREHESQVGAAEIIADRLSDGSCDHGG